ncbi:MAG: hypothetical protein RL318_532 [Fibrobacterota bacterium]|jgi:uncharacterized protein (TIGR02147 family)
MLDVFAYEDHRRFLADSIEEMRTTKRGFSLRWLANKCDFSSHTFLPRVLTGDRNLTSESAAKVAEALGLRGEKAKAFLCLVEASIGLTEETRTKAWGRFESLRAVHRRKRLEGKQSRYYGKWYYPVVRQLAVWAPWHGDWSKLSDMLDPPIHPEEAKEAVETLVELGLLTREVDGTFHTSSPILNVDRLPSHTKRLSREEILRRGMESLLRHPLEERSTTCLLLAMSETSYRQSVEILGEAAQRCLGLAASDPEVDRVWQVALQIFPVSRRFGAKA